MLTLDSPSAPPSDRIGNAVERELARRRRLLRLYLLLLLVPLGLAAWFLAVGRSDHEILRQTMDQTLELRVAPVEEHYEQIAPKLKQVESLDKALPVVQQAAEQLRAQEKQVATLQQQVQQVREIVPAVHQLQANQITLMRTVETSGELKGLADRIKAMEGSLASVKEQQSELQRDLKAVQLKVDKQPAGPAYNLDPKQLDDLIDARLRALAQRGKGVLIKGKDLPKEPPPPQ